LALHFEVVRSEEAELALVGDERSERSGAGVLGVEPEHSLDELLALIERTSRLRGLGEERFLRLVEARRPELRDAARREQEERGGRRRPAHPARDDRPRDRRQVALRAARRALRALLPASGVVTREALAASDPVARLGAHLLVAEGAPAPARADLDRERDRRGRRLGLEERLEHALAEHERLEEGRRRGEP